MNERIQRALDGDVEARASFTEHEAAVFAETEEMVRKVLQSIPAEPIPDVSASVLAAIGRTSAARPSPIRHIRDWLWAPRPVALQWRPAYAFAALLALAALPLLRQPAAPVAPAARQQVLVQFRFDAPTARQVQLAGNFTDWKASVPLKRTAAGTWTVVVPLDPGVHNYSFVVDGREWVADPMAPAVADGFGGENSQLAVLTPDGARSL